MNDPRTVPEALDAATTGAEFASVPSSLFGVLQEAKDKEDQ